MHHPTVREISSPFLASHRSERLSWRCLGGTSVHAFASGGARESGGTATRVRG